MTNATRTEVDRFWANVLIAGPDECWLWLGSVGSHGYGQIQIQKKSALAHRVAWELTNGQIPRGLVICHSCDTPLCCNPRHHFLGTHKDNAMDKVKKGRAPSKLNPDKVRELRDLYAAGWSTRRLARHFDVDRRAVVFALNGKTWAHVDGPAVPLRHEPPLGKSGVRGVRQIANGRFRARITVAKRDIHLGYFDSAEAAARAYDEAAQKLQEREPESAS